VFPTSLEFLKRLDVSSRRQGACSNARPSRPDHPAPASSTPARRSRDGGVPAPPRLASLNIALTQAVLTGDIFPGLVRIIHEGDESSCPGLAAAALAVCLLRCPDTPLPSGLQHDMVGATASFLHQLRARWQDGGELDAESVYMATALLRIALLRASAAAAAVEGDAARESTYAEGTPVGKAMHDVLYMLDGLLESEHLHAVSMSLALLASAAATSSLFKLAIAESSCIGKVCGCCMAVYRMPAGCWGQCGHQLAQW
jgi:hypothetical protein